MNTKELLLPINFFDGPNWMKGWKIRFSPRFFNYKPFLSFKIETRNYILKTANTKNELIDLFALRYSNFLIGTELENPKDQFDIDELDHLCDHIIIKEKESDKVVGTYRIFNSETTDHFYSESEFNMESFIQAPGKKLELGRACIDESHRTGRVIDLLWKGIAHYVTKTNSRYLFGCTSVYTTNAVKSLAIYEYMNEKDWVSNDFKITPNQKHQMNLEKLSACPTNDFCPKSFVPSLLKSYISAGAKVHGHPALDKEFGCVDFLTVLDTEKLSPLFKKRYFKELG